MEVSEECGCNCVPLERSNEGNKYTFLLFCSALLLAGGFVVEPKKSLEEGKFILLKGTASPFQEFLFMTAPLTPAKLYLSPLTSLPHTVKLHAFFPLDSDFFSSPLTPCEIYFPCTLLSNTQGI